MSVNPIGGVTNLPAVQQPLAAQTSFPSTTGPTAAAAQAWEAALRSVLGDNSSSTTSGSTDPLLSTLSGASTAAAPTADPLTSAANPLGASAATGSDPLLSLLTGSSTPSADPLVTSLSDPTASS